MNKPKAPKDMTAPELVAEIKRRIESGALEQPFDYNDLYGILTEPAPNPFTPDQLQKQIGCIFCRGHENDHEFYIDGNVLFYTEGQCGTEGIIISLCPKCGTPLPIPCEGGEKG